jgi:IclR family transcriptional regulator, pca regulon regulatory protein
MTQTPSERIDETHRDFVAALARGLSVIQAFTEDQPEMTLSEVAQVAQMNVATARRALLTLHSLGYVGMQGKRFLLLPKVLSLGVAYLRSMNFKDLVNPYLQEVADGFRDSVSFAILDGDDVVYLGHVPSKRSIMRRASVGYRLPAFCTSLGRVLLANQPLEEQQRLLTRAPFPQYTAKTLVQRDDLAREFAKALTDGFATQQDEIEMGVVSIAVPVCDPQGQVIAAINCSSETDRTTAEDLIATRLPVLREARAQIEWAIRRAPALVHSIRSS